MTVATARWMLCVLCFILAAPQICLGQPPRYEPYGSWRGRIRYVEGPRRVRTRIHWGNGITPVGGQVLMHLGTVAGTVFTNPNVLGALAGGAAPRNAEIDPELVSTIQAVGQKNDELRTALNEVRALVQLQPLAAPVATLPSPGPGVTGSGNLDLNALGTQWNSFNEAVENRRREVRRDALAAIKIGDAIAAGLSEPQRTIHAQIKDHVVRTAVLSENVAELPPVAIDAATAEQFDAQVKNVKEGWTSLGEVLGRAISVGGQILTADPSANEDNRLQNRLDTLRRFQGEVQALRL